MSRTAGKKSSNKKVFKSQVRDIKGKFGTIKVTSIKRRNREDFNVAKSKLVTIRSKLTNLENFLY